MEHCFLCFRSRCLLDAFVRIWWQRPLCPVSEAIKPLGLNFARVATFKSLQLYFRYEENRERNTNVFWFNEATIDFQAFLKKNIALWRICPQSGGSSTGSYSTTSSYSGRMSSYSGRMGNPGWRGGPSHAHLSHLHQAHLDAAARDRGDRGDRYDDPRYDHDRDRRRGPPRGYPEEYDDDLPPPYYDSRRRSGGSGPPNYYSSRGGSALSSIKGDPGYYNDGRSGSYRKGSIPVSNNVSIESSCVYNSDRGSGGYSSGRMKGKCGNNFSSTSAYDNRSPTGGKGGYGAPGFGTSYSGDPYASTSSRRSQKDYEYRSRGPPGPTSSSYLSKGKVDHVDDRDLNGGYRRPAQSSYDHYDGTKGGSGHDSYQQRPISRDEMNTAANMPPNMRGGPPAGNSSSSYQHDYRHSASASSSMTPNHGGRGRNNFYNSSSSAVAPGASGGGSYPQHSHTRTTDTEGSYQDRRRFEPKQRGGASNNQGSNRFSSSQQGQQQFSTPGGGASSYSRGSSHQTAHQQGSQFSNTSRGPQFYNNDLGGGGHNGVQGATSSATSSSSVAGGLAGTGLFAREAGDVLAMLRQEDPYLVQRVNERLARNEISEQEAIDLVKDSLLRVMCPPQGTASNSRN
ncbi:unnamed protein product [Amoebophrya sp. A25]|nr:unnamed protein product [Amoebophrya sp. A25]|eukprot:GSA25T00023291001.1